MRLFIILLGIAAGLGFSTLLSAFVAPGDRGSRARVARPEALPDHAGRLRTVVLHATASGAGVMGQAWRDFVPHLSATTTVYLVCENEATVEMFRQEVGAVRCRIEPVLVNQAITPWSRDRWLARREGGDMALLLPEHEDGSRTWAARAGDAHASRSLAAALGRAVHQPGWDFDGGDVVCDDRTAFVAPGVIAKNLGRIASTREELIQVMEDQLGKRVVLLTQAPRHHAGMYLMVLGDDTVMVGDPSLGARLLAPERPRPICPVGDDESPAMQAAYDSVARQAQAAGYRVVRVPAVHGLDERTVITYTNAILETRDGERICYLPAYRHVPELNQAAIAIWQQLGWQVQPVDCTELYIHGGTLRCIVNVADRD
jgi:N-dimethylarginine dimethylaminohydrolase